MTEPKPEPLSASEYLAMQATLRSEREAARAAADALVPVEGGEPIPSEEPPPVRRGDTF